MHLLHHRKVLKIVYVITGLGVGGAESQVLSLADGFAEQGHRVDIVYLTGPALLKPRNPSVNIFDLAMRKSPVSVVAASWQLASLIRQRQPDVVHSHMFHANIIVRLLRIVLKIPRLISTAHSSNEGGHLRMTAYRLTNHLADTTTNVSKEAVRAFECKGAVKSRAMVAVYNGICLRRFCRDESARLSLRRHMQCEHKQVIIAVGRLVEAKDYPNLLRAFAIVAKSNAKVILWITGEGPLKAELVALTAHLGIQDKVSFLGVRSDIPELLSAADLFVLASAWEGFGIVVGEAMACGCPVVATDAGGVAEVLGGHGRLVPPRCHTALSNAIESMLAMPAKERAIICLGARRHIESQFSLDAALRRWGNIYRAEEQLE